MTHPAIPVANCQILNKRLTYTKGEREFMNLTMNSLSLSGGTLFCASDRRVRAKADECSQTAAGFAGFGKDVVRCGMNAESG